VTDPAREVQLPKSLEENGLYLCLCASWSRVTRGFQSYLIGRTMRVRHFSIGADHFLKGLAHIKIGENFKAGKGLWLQAINLSRNADPTPKIVIGENFSISFWGHIAATDCVEIGSNVMVGSKVTIIDHNHGSYGPLMHCAPRTPPKDRPLIGRPIVIGSNVWIGDGVVVAPGATIGEGCVIGANAVVTGYIPPYCMAVGIPARTIKKYDFDKMEWRSCSLGKPEHY
jgi:acetyltransferase-like isoleucine patch superfamily enzyme